MVPALHPVLLTFGPDGKGEKITGTAKESVGPALPARSAHRFKNCRQPGDR